MSARPWRVPTGCDPRSAAAGWDLRAERYDLDQDKRRAKRARVVKRQAEDQECAA